MEFRSSRSNQFLSKNMIFLNSYAGEKKKFKKNNNSYTSEFFSKIS